MFGRATIRLGIGPHSSLFYFILVRGVTHVHVRYKLMLSPVRRLSVCLSVVCPI